MNVECCSEDRAFCRSCPERCFDDDPYEETTPPKWSARMLEAIRQWCSQILRRS